MGGELSTKDATKVRDVEESSLPGSGENLRLRGLFAAEQAGIGFLLALADFELAKDGVLGDINLMPLVFEIAQNTFAHLAEVTKGRGVAHQSVDFLLGRGADLDGGKNELELLDEHALGLEKVNVVFGSELFDSPHVHEDIELFPALEIVLHLVNELVQFFVLHTNER